MEAAWRAVPATGGPASAAPATSNDATRLSTAAGRPRTPAARGSGLPLSQPGSQLLPILEEPQGPVAALDGAETMIQDLNQHYMPAEAPAIAATLPVALPAPKRRKIIRRSLATGSQEGF